MNIEKNLRFLQKQYDFEFSVQIFRTDVSGHFYGPMKAYSYHNAHGCFTVYHAVQRNEWDYYTAGEYSSDQAKLLSCNINDLVFTAIKKARKKSLKNIFKCEIAIIGEIIKNQISETGNFFGIKV